MKISFQNPTKGPLITVSFDDETAAVSRAFSLVGASRVASAGTKSLATLRTAAQFAQTAPGIVSGGAAGGSAGLGLTGIAGPAMFIEMFFAAGDAPQHKSDNDSVTPPTALTPNQLRCMANPYDTSAECAAVRSALAILPFSESWLSNPNAAQATTNSHAAHPSGTMEGGANLAGAVTSTMDLEEKLAVRHLETQTVVATLRAELSDIERRLDFPSTTDEMQSILQDRRAQLQIELTDAVLAAAWIMAPRANPGGESGATLAELKWPAPLPIVAELPSDHDPQVVPQNVLQTYHRYVRDNDHTAIMLLWNTQEKRYELERGWPRPFTFSSNMRLVRTALPPFLPRTWFSDPGLDLTWYFVPSREHRLARV